MTSSNMVSRKIIFSPLGEEEPLGLCAISLWKKPAASHGTKRSTHSLRQHAAWTGGSGVSLWHIKASARAMLLSQLEYFSSFDD